MASLPMDAIAPSATATLPDMPSVMSGRDGTESIDGLTGMAPSIFSPSFQREAAPLVPAPDIPTHLWVEAVHFALAKRSEYMYSQREAYLRFTQSILDAGPALIDQYVTAAKAFMAEVEEQARLVFHNAYYASIHQLEGELSHA